MVWNIHYGEARQKAIQKFNMQKYLSQIYRMAHNWWYKKDYWTWKNKSKMWNIIFSYDDLFLKKTSLKIFQVRLNLAIYLIISLFIRLFDRTFCSTILFNKLSYYLNLLFRAIFIQKVISSWKLKLLVLKLHGGILCKGKFPVTMSTYCFLHSAFFSMNAN